MSLLTITLSAQSPASPPAGSDWSRVQRVAVGTEIRIRTKPPAPHTTVFPPTHMDCLFVSASDDQLVCTRTYKVLFFPIHRQFNIARPDVTTIRITRGDLSSFVGGAIGAGSAVGATAIGIAAGGNSDHSEDVIAYTLVAVLGASVGSGIGRHTDFMGGPTIYRAP